MKPLGQHPLPLHTIAHLSDPHLLAQQRLYGAVDTTAHLRQAMKRLTLLETPPQAIVFTGDLADRAEPDAYRRLREIVEPEAAQMGAEVVWVMGNHDEPEPFARELHGERSAPAPPWTACTTWPGCASSRWTRRCRATTTASSRRPSWSGWPPSWPSRPSTAPLLALHHAPIPVPMTRLSALIELADQDRLAEVVTGTDVRGVLGGHFHFSSFSTFAGVPVSVASATCYVADPASTERFMSSIDGHQSFTMVHAYADRLVHSVVPLAGATEIAGYGVDLAERLESLPLAEARSWSRPRTRRCGPTRSRSTERPVVRRPGPGQRACRGMDTSRTTGTRTDAETARCSRPSGPRSTSR